MAPAVARSTSNRSAVPGSTCTSHAARRPPAAKPIENPPTIRGKNSFIWRTSSSRPACAPTRKKPTGIASGKSTTSGKETQSESLSVRTRYAAATSTAYPLRTVIARAARLNRACARRIAHETATPDTATTR